MRNRVLHDRLRDFALEAAALLTDEQRAGAELEFDVVDESVRRGPVLYRYRPRTSEFLAQRWNRLRGLPACSAAGEALGAGASAYLCVAGLPGERAEPALRAMLERLYEDATTFAFPEERFERVYAEVEETLYRDTMRATVAAPLHGVVIGVSRVDLGDGLWLVRHDAIDSPPDSAETLCVLERDLAPEDGSLADAAAGRFGDLVTGMRLFRDGRVTLGPVGWRRASEEGRWQPLPLESTGPGRGEPWVLAGGEEEALRGFLRALESYEVPGSVTWALARFEMGCSRAGEAEAISDYLLALRALLDAGEAGDVALPLRVAALCAEEGERRSVQRHMELSLSLERFVMSGGRDDRDLHEWVGARSPRALVAELERHTRALVRDVLCGHLEPDLARVADDILFEVPDPSVISARDLRAPRSDPADIAARGLRAQEEDTSELEALPRGAVRERLQADWKPSEPGLGLDLEPDAEPEPEPVADPELIPERRPRFEREPLGVTPSVDWDEDPASYSAPV